MNSPGDAGAEAWELMVALLMARRWRLNPAAEAEGLTRVQGFALMNLNADAPRPTRALADALQCDPSMATSIVDRLEELGFVNRRVSATDRRVKEVVVTPAGRAAQTRLRATMVAPPPGLERLSERDKRTLRRIVRRIVGEDLSLESALHAPPTGMSIPDGPRSSG